MSPVVTEMDGLVRVLTELDEDVLETDVAVMELMPEPATALAPKNIACPSVIEQEMSASARLIEVLIKVRIAVRPVVGES
jgi:hypothetical protein